jgi:hypothetical protein
MQLSHEEVEEYLEYISTGIKIEDINDRTLIFKYPSTLNKMIARRIYRSEYDKSLKEGMLTHDQMEKLIKDRNLVSDEDRSQIKKFESQLEAQKILLVKTTKVKANQDRIKNIIADLESKKSAIEMNERSKYAMTAETRAEEAKVLYLCYCSTYDFDTDKLYWNSFQDFKDEHSYSFRQDVLYRFINFYSGLRTTIIRAIARSNLWRIKYITSLKTGNDLFSLPISDYTNDMLNLVYWAHYYNNINEMMPEDQPPENILDDDESLDAFMQDYYNERTRDTADRKYRNGTKTTMSAFNQEEVIVARTNELFEDIEFDEPREAAAIKNKTLIQKKSRRT